MKFMMDGSITIGTLDAANIETSDKARAEGFCLFGLDENGVAEAHRDTDRWDRMSILNSANSGLFSSDRTIQQYAAEAWNIDPIEVQTLCSD